jgi:hypothetical protein
MMELIVAILIAIGSVNSQADFNDDAASVQAAEVSTAKTIIDNNQFNIDERTGGVVVDPGVGV